MTVGGITLVVFGIFVGVIVWGCVTIAPLMKEATQYADEAVPAIAAKWDSEELMKRAAPQLKATFTPAILASAYAMFSSFGPMAKYNGSKCSVGEARDPQTGKRVVATCVASASCENADVMIRLGLVRIDEAWEIGAIIVQKTSRGSMPAQGVTAFGLGTLEHPEGVLLFFDVGRLARHRT
jgi:hypothetical protein